MFEILMAIQSELKFNYMLIKSEDLKYGTLDKSKGWTGQIGLVQRGEIDFSIMDHTILLERSKVFSFGFTWIVCMVGKFKAALVVHKIRKSPKSKL